MVSHAGVQVGAGTLPVNHQIVYLLQDVFNLLPDVTLQSFVRAVYVKTNDQQLVLYVAALVRATAKYVPSYAARMLNGSQRKSTNVMAAAILVPRNGSR